MKIIHYTTSFKALNNHINTYNQSQEELSGHIRHGAAATARDIVRLYGSYLMRVNSINTIDPNNPPGLRTNNMQLVKSGHISPRTVQRHIKRLQEVKIIIKKVWHGTNADYELWINPGILLIKHQKSVEEAKMALQQSMENGTYGPIESKLTPTCRHTDTGNNSYITNIVIGVDKPGAPVETFLLGHSTADKIQRSSLSFSGELDQTAYKTGDKTTGYTGEKRREKN